MFEVQFTGHDYLIVEGKTIYSCVRLIIDRCPPDGIDAIDFRLAHGLEPAPINHATVPPLTWADEAFVRENKALANGNANLVWKDKASAQKEWYVEGAAGQEVLRSRERGHKAGLYGIASASAIAAYMREPTPDTCRDLIRDMWFYEVRSRARAAHEIHNLATHEGRASALADVFRGDGEALALAVGIIDSELDGMTI
jgi:hypothetical protein